MATIASLRVALEADTSKFKSAMNSATDGVKKFAAAGAAVAAAGSVLIKAGLDSADQLQKMSLRTGISVEALSALSHAAELAGTDINTFQRGVNNMHRAIGNAERGQKAYADAIGELGLSLSDLKKLAPEQQFALISDRMNAMEDSAKAASIGQQIFGGAYRKLLPLMKSGSAGMQKAADDAKNLGLILSTDSANAAAEANDQISRLKGTFSALSRTLSVSLAPALASALEGLTANLPGIIAAVKAAFSGVGTAIGGVAFAASQVFSGDFEGAASTIGGIGGDVDAAVQAELDKVSQNTGDQVRILTEINDNLRGSVGVAG